MKTIKKIDAWSVAKLSLVLNAVFGFFIGLFIMGMTYFVPAPQGEQIPFYFGISAPIVMPLLYALIGLVSGYLGALFYNIIAKWVGGIKVELVD